MPERTIEVVEEIEELPPDRVVQGLQVAIALVIITGLAGLAYLLIGGIIDPPAPRTALEAQLIAVRQAAETNPESGEVWADYVTALTAVGRMTEAHRQLENGRKLLAGDQLLLLNIQGVNLLNAEERYEEALALADENVKLEAEERAKLIKKETEKGVFVDPKLYGPEIVTEMHLSRATAAAGLQQWETAIESLSVALEYSPRAADLYFLRGDARMRSNDTEGAIADFKQSLRFDPEFEAARVALEKAGEL